jgi:hypothetical protein
VCKDAQAEGAGREVAVCNDDPEVTRAARVLRDRYPERVNASPAALSVPMAKDEVSRSREAPERRQDARACVFNVSLGKALHRRRHRPGIFLPNRA